MRSRYATVLLIAVAAAASLVAWFALRKGPEINVILISVDTLRPDRLGCYGYAAGTSPNIDRLAREGITFEDAISSVPLTLPSHASILTGLYPISHGIRDNGTFSLRPDFTTLAEIFKDAGYHTAAFVGAFVLDSRYGLDQGFDSYDDDLTGGRQLSAFGYSEKTADAVSGAARAWLEGAEEPFFTFLHYYDPHTPYEAPAEYRKRHPLSSYDAEVAFTDFEIGRFLADLERLGLAERTLVVLVSDHGEGLGQHGEATHGYLVYEPTLRVPFIMSLPEESGLAGSAERGARIGFSVRLIDVMPTVLDAVGLEMEAAVDGRSLLPLVRGESLAPEFCYFETLYPYFAYRWSPLRGVRFNEWKYILAPEAEMYDVGGDRAESDNLIAREGERAAELDRALKEFMRLEAEAGSGAGAQMSAEEVRRLSALGYISRSHSDLPGPDDMTGAHPVRMMRYIDEFMAPGEDAYNRGDLQTALEKFTRLVQVDPGNPEAHLHRGKVLLDMGALDEAAAAYQEALGIDSTSSAACFHLGNIAQGRGHMDEALDYYESALRLMPGSPEALANIGSILVERGMTDSAVVLLKSALEVDPVNEVALVNLGIVYSRLKMHDEALAAFLALLEVNPGHTKALANCGVLYVAKGDADSMVYYFKAAVESDPGDPKNLFNLGSAYRRKEMMTEAGECYEKVVEMQPDNLLALFGLAAVRAGQGRRDEAIALLERALEIDPDFELASNALRMLQSGNQ